MREMMLSVFVTVFLAELGDKTQLAAMLFSTKAEGARWAVFLAASAALVLSTAIAVFAGAFVTRFVAPETLGRVAAVGFIALGAWMLWKG